MRSYNGKSFFRFAKFQDLRLPASLTCECAFVLPLFFLAAVTLILFMNAVSLQVRTDLDLSNRVRQMAVLAGEASQAAGAAGVAGAESSSGEKTGETLWIDLPGVRVYDLPVSLIPQAHIKVAARARVYPWTGIRSWSGTDYEAGPDESEMVYVTDNREVYHTHADCTHLDLTIIATTLDDVGKLRNADGKKYKPCSGFPKNYSGTIYVTAQGDYYYPSLSYGSLTRHVHLVKKSDLPVLPLCERCAGKDDHYHEAA